ncbi:MAG: glycosyltransferase family 4 protein [Pseudobacter sp.]|uniref:glycosyltransferase family 4 protein n=1 Tax=Pseudobacter sp. TaxID=2045420 RepID=UPI003F7D53EF
MGKRLAIVITHPIQYYVPVFQLLSARGNIQLKVFYTWEQEAAGFDKGFGRKFNWDIPLLDGYEYEFISNEGRTGKSFYAIRNPDLVKKIKAWEPDMVLVYGWNYYSHLAVMRHFKSKIPVIFRGDSTLLNKGQGLKFFVKKQLLKFIYGNVDMALYVGSRSREYFREFGLNEDQLFFAPHSIDNNRFSTLNAEQQAFVSETRQKLNLTDNTLTILFAGKFQDTKNPGLLVDAVLELNDPSVHLLMVGNGHLENELKEKASGAENIHFMPFQNQSMMPAVYKLGDVYCLPSKGETWGLAVNESMASQRAILVSDKVGCAEDLVKPENGFVFPSGNMEALKQCIVQLKDKNIVSRMGSMSFEIIKDWSIDRQVDAMETVFLKKLPKS